MKIVKKTKEKIFRKRWQISQKGIDNNSCIVYDINQKEKIRNIIIFLNLNANDCRNKPTNETGKRRRYAW